jgi:hypothetical protein
MIEANLKKDRRYSVVRVWASKTTEYWLQNLNCFNENEVLLNAGEDPLKSCLSPILAYGGGL